MTVRVHLIEDAARLAVLEPGWRDLWARTPNATPFQHPDWLIPWWQHLPKGALCTLVAERGRDMVGLLPLCAVAEGDRTVLRPLAFDVSDYAEPLIAPDDRRETLAALLQALARARGWDVCAWVLREQAQLDQQASSYGLQVERTPLEASPGLNLAGAYPDCLPAGIRNSLAEAQRRLRKLGEATFESAAPESVDGILDTLFALHRRRWRERGGEGVLAHPAVQAFHREAAARLARSDLLRLHRLRIGGDDAAVFYGVAAKGRVHYYIGGFDPDRAEVSPGTLVIAHALERATRAGERTFDFLKGQEPYKYRWGATDRARWSVEITRAEEAADAPAPEPDARFVRA